MVKKTLKIIWEEFIYGGHLISLGGVGIILTSALLLNIEITLDPIIIVYLFTYSSILHNRYKEQGTDFLTNPERTENLKKYFRRIILIIFSSIVVSVGILLYFNKIKALIFIILLILSAFLYTKYFKKTTKKLIAFKNIYFSLVASSLSIFLVLYYSYLLFNISLFFIFIFIFLRMFINTVFLDIKDIKSDKKENLLTLPIVLGREKSLMFLKAMTVLSVLPIIIAVYFGLFPLFSLVLILIIPYSFYYFQKSVKKENFHLVNYIFADLEFVLWPILILFAKIIL